MIPSLKGVLSQAHDDRNTLRRVLFRMSPDDVRSRRKWRWYIAEAAYKSNIEILDTPSPAFLARKDCPRV
jgi:hypothetical protein